MAAIVADMSQLKGWKMRIKDQVADVLERRGRYAETEDNKRPSLFEELRDTEKLPAQEKTASRLTDEGFILLIAGSETPAKTLALTLFHLLSIPTKLQRLRSEITEAMPNPQASLPALNTLEKMPFLTACLLEGLRLHSGIVGRSPRCAPSPLTYRSSDGTDWLIPAGTPVSMQSPMMHFNEEIFPEPKQFRPERWIVTGKNGRQAIDNALKKYLVAFGAGTRSCLGYNLGMAMLYYGVTAMTVRFDYELYDTTAADVELQFVWMIPQPKVDTQGVRVVVTRVRD